MGQSCYHYFDQLLLVIFSFKKYKIFSFKWPQYYSLAGALVANLTILAFQRKDPNFLEYVITNEEAKDKFSISDTGLLHTKVTRFNWLSY